MATTWGSTASRLRGGSTQHRPGALVRLLAYEAEHRREAGPIYTGTNALVRFFTDDRAPCWRYAAPSSTWRATTAARGDHA